MFRKIMLSSVAAIALPAVTFAADMPMSMKARAPVAAVYSWTGFYIGGSAGVAYNDPSTDYSAVSLSDTDYSQPILKGSKLGATVGGTVGYNYQMQNFVIGAEGDISYLGALKKTVIGPYYDCSVTSCYGSAQTGADAFATIRGRVGIDFSGTLVYGTAGFGWVKLKDNYNTLGTSGKGGNFSSSKWAPAFVVGGGLEHMITPNWSIKGEFLYLMVESQSAPATTLNYYNSSPAIAVNYTGNVSIGRVGVNYKFN